MVVEIKRGLMDKEKKSVGEILEDLVNHTVKQALGYASNEYADKDIDQAKHSLVEVLGNEKEIIKIIQHQKNSGYVFCKTTYSTIIDLAQAISEWIKKEIND
jgi:hypothetical protein